MRPARTERMRQQLNTGEAPPNDQVTGTGRLVTVTQLNRSRGPCPVDRRVRQEEGFRVAVRKRGFRRIVVDGVEYRWKFPRRLTDQEEQQPGVWAVAQRVEPAGSMLLVVFPNRHHMSGPHAAEGKPVLPSDVAAGIREALEAGWQSERAGSQFRWQVADAEQSVAPDCGGIN